MSYLNLYTSISKVSSHIINCLCIMLEFIILYIFSAVPYFTVEPEIINAAEDETVELKCEASGVPEPQITWIHNGLPITDSIKNANPRRTVSPNSIRIEKLVKKDTGNYGCNATNSLGYVYKDVYINVLGMKSIFLMYICTLFSPL